MAREMRAVGVDFLDTAAHRFVYHAVIRRTPEQVFDTIASQPAGYGDWYPGFDHSGRWLSTGPPGVGSRRRVRMARVSYEETILEWERPARFAFRVDRATVPLARALAEGYRIGDHPSGTALEWVFTIDPGPFLGPLLGRSDPVLSRLFTRASSNLEKYLPPEA